MLRKFASIAHPETHGYAYDSEAWTSQAPIDTHFRMFETYGDGLCQHSGDWAITSEYFADYMLSLADAMLADSELAKHLVFNLLRGPNREEIEFCASVVFKPREDGARYEKTARYYSVSERKVSSSASKEHDKRYERVADWNNGSPDAIYRMLRPDWARGLEFYQWATAIHKWACDSKGQYMQLPGVFLEWTKDPDKARDMRRAFEAACEVVESYRLRCSAESTIENERKRMEHRKESTEAAA